MCFLSLWHSFSSFPGVVQVYCNIIKKWVPSTINKCLTFSFCYLSFFSQKQQRSPSENWNLVYNLFLILDFFLWWFYKISPSCKNFSLIEQQINFFYTWISLIEKLNQLALPLIWKFYFSIVFCLLNKPNFRTLWYFK